MALTRPLTCVYRPDERISYLTFPKDSTAPDGRYYMRGGMCWPTETQTSSGPVAVGCLLIAGVNVDTGILYVFEDQHWRCIDHIVERGRIRWAGIAPVFGLAFSFYALTHYFWHQDFALYAANYKQIGMSDQIMPKPHFINVEWREDSVPMSIVWGMLEQDRLKYRAGADLHGDIQRNKDARQTPGVMALAALCMGLAKYPWRKSDG